MTMKSIAIYLPDLSGGGAERLQINLAHYFLEQGIAVDFVLDRVAGALLKEVPAQAKIVDLGSKRTSLAPVRLARYLRDRRPDFLLSGLGHNNIVALMAKILSRASTRIIIGQHNFLSAEITGNFKYRLLPWLYRRLLPAAAGVVAVSQGTAADFAALTNCAPEKITVIYNGVVTAEFDQRATAPPAHHWFGDDIPVFVAAGRLVAQKDFPTLLRAFAQLVARRPARLVVIGEGPLKPELEQLAHDLAIADKVDFAGFHAHPFPFFRAASAVVVSSRYEGFALVLAEALACGTPVVSTNCPHGPAEILDNGTYGLLTPVGDAKALAHAMAETLDHPLLRDFLRARGGQFSVAACGMHYLKLFETVAGT